ncbi:DUF7511 domain-containing protein [Halosimplex marinum]|uniref:DUF7511 domain-containing protein n=1 Tax=Halosimplex marinum TaxID=3396620 RepID=UPI003F57A49F
MSGRPQPADDAVSEPRSPSTGPDQPGRTDPPALELALVRYADRPDRCTIHPPDATGVERMSTWISVDRTLVVDAASMR